MVSKREQQKRYIQSAKEYYPFYIELLRQVKLSQKRNYKIIEILVTSKQWEELLIAKVRAQGFNKIECKYVSSDDFNIAYGHFMGIPVNKKYSNLNNFQLTIMIEN